MQKIDIWAGGMLKDTLVIYNRHVIYFQHSYGGPLELWQKN